MAYKNGLAQVVARGNNVADLELTTLPSGAVKCEFRLAKNDGYVKADGTEVDHCSFIPFVCFGKQAENLVKYIVRGQELMVIGELFQDQWQNAEGQNRSKLYVKALQIDYGPKPKGYDGDNGGGEYQQPAPAAEGPVDEVPF